MHRLTCVSTLIVSGALAIAPALQARTCSGNGDLLGGFGWSGSRAVPFVSATPVTAINGSTTQIGGLTAGAANSAAFASVGRVYLDGNGGIFSTSTPLTTLLQVGTYAVNPDCTVSATLTDAFATPGAAGLTPVQASVTFEGFVVQNFNEIDLVQTGTAAAGAVITLRKVKQFNSCGIESLTGTFGLAASGVATVGRDALLGAVSSPFTLFGRINADGTGFLVQDSVGLVSPLTTRQFTGTYTVNQDCTGSATLTGSDTKSRKIDFVIVTPGGPNPTNATKSLVFAFTDPGVVGSGLAQQQ